MINKAFKSIKGVFNDVKDIVNEKVQNASVPNIPNPISNTFTINGKNYYENKLLGEGGYGYVYEVSDGKGNKYALKKMNILNKIQYNNILHEVNIWKQISKNCNNIVKLLDVAENQTEVDILMELCTEGSLLDYINNSNEDIPENVALNIIKNIANGLDGMHSQNPPIAHRDVKIENVLKFGNTFKLCDFGSASIDILIPEKETKESKRDKFDIFERNTTFMYRPPEMVDEYGSFPVNEKVDIWALGCILYAILFKQQPFQDAQKLTIIKGDYYIPKEANNYSEKIFDFIRWMLTPDPRLRPSAKDILRCINNWNEIKNFPLCDQVLEIKKRQIKIFKEKMNKKGKGDISEAELEKAKLSIMNKLKKKSKYQRKDIDNLEGVFDEDDDDGSKSKYKNIGNQFNNNNQNMNNNGNNNGFNFNNFFNNNQNNQNNQNKSNDLLGFDFSNNFSQNKNSNQSMSNCVSFNNNNNNNSNNNGFNFDNFNNKSNNNISNNNNGFDFNANFSNNNNNNNKNLGFNFDFAPQPQNNKSNNNFGQFQQLNNNNQNNNSKSHNTNDQNILDFFS